MAAVETKRLAARAVMAMTLFMAISFTLDRASRRTCPAKRGGHSAVPACGAFAAARASQVTGS